MYIVYSKHYTFTRYDGDGSGELDVEELTKLINNLGVITTKEVNRYKSAEL